MDVPKNIGLGRLTPVELRKVWADEPSDFTPWLAEAENLTLLGDAIGLELEPGDTEVAVGDFNADIVCSDAASGAPVLIENQLEQTDHIHMGQLLTYAAGLDAETVVWVAKEFRDEHRAALDWLNTKFDAARFFGLAIELWEVNGSPPAPRFNVVAQPNDWFRTIKETARSTDEELEHREFWDRVNRHLAKTGILPRPNPKTTPTAHFRSIRNNQFQLRASLSKQKRQLQVALVIRGPDSVAFANLVKQSKFTIDKEIRLKLRWRIREVGKESVLSVERPDSDTENQDEWDDYAEWIAKHLDAFKDAFFPIVEVLDPSTYKPDEQDPDGDGS